MTQRHDDADQKWADLDAQYNRFRERLSEVRTEQRKLLMEMKDLTDEMLKKEDPEISNWACANYSGFFGQRVATDLLWSMVLDLLRDHASSELATSAIIIGIMEPAATDEPIYPDDINGLMRILLHPDLADNVFAAYDCEHFPVNLITDFYKWRDRVALPRDQREFPFALLQEYMDIYHEA